MDVDAAVAAARGDPAVALLEGVHALKHALRFGAEVRWVVTPDAARLRTLVVSLAPDIADAVDALVVPVDGERWLRLTRGGLPSPALAVAARPTIDVGDVLATEGSAPVVLLEDPTHLGNVGAAIRVAAAAGAGGVVTTGDADPWHPSAIRGAAGLQFALPVAGAPSLPEHTRPVVAIDPGGRPLGSVAIPSGAVLAFGTERRGLSATVRSSAALTVGIPMRRGVSSLNLATAVAVVLYGVPGLSVADVDPKAPVPRRYDEGDIVPRDRGAS